MEKISVIKFRQHLSEYLNQAKYQHQRIAVTRNGQILGAFVPCEDLETLEALEMKEDIKAYDKAIDNFKNNGEKTISLEEFQDRIGL